MKSTSKGTVVLWFGLWLALPVAALAGQGKEEFAKGWDLLKQKQYPEARAALEAGLLKTPADAQAHYFLAEACRGLKDWPCAEEHYETSLELDDKSSEAGLAKPRLKKAKAWRLLDEAKSTIADSQATPEKLKQAQETLEVANTMGLDDEQQAVYQQLQEKLQAGLNTTSRSQTDIIFEDVKTLGGLVIGNGRMKRIRADGFEQVKLYPVREMLFENESDTIIVRFVPDERCGDCWHQSVEVPLRDIEMIDLLPPVKVGPFPVTFFCRENTRCITIEEGSHLYWKGGELEGLRSEITMVFASPSLAKRVAEKANHLCEILEGCKDEKILETSSVQLGEMPMVMVPAGEFLMGNNQGGNQSWDFDEKPAHLVYLDAYYMDKYEVTVWQYAKFLEATGRDAPPDWNILNQSQHQKRPVVKVEWADADAYCRWAGKRLPTEAEWEKAARGTDERTYPWGNSPPTHLHANFGKSDWNNHAALNPVGLLEDGKSPYGIYDMAGNVWEWVSDWYDKNYYYKGYSQNPTGPSSGEFKVLRGGSWSSQGSLRSVYRMEVTPAYRNDHVGFRCGKTP